MSRAVSVENNRNGYVIPLRVKAKARAVVDHNPKEKILVGRLKAKMWAQETHCGLIFVIANIFKVIQSFQRI
jgi:hypothetical protein